jgi:hypothetical protein
VKTRTFSKEPGATLNTFTYSHECRLLREPWPSQAKTPSGERVYARPCLFGRDCQGMSPHMPGHSECGGVVLTEAMTPAEADEFDEKGAHPPFRRVCVLCSRFVTMDAYMFTNKSRPVPSNVLLNWYEGQAARSLRSLAHACPWTLCCLGQGSRASLLALTGM